MKKIIFSIIAIICLLGISLFVLSYHWYAVTIDLADIGSYSMAPTLVPGEFSFIDPFQSPEVGDIIQFSCRPETPCATLYSNRVRHRWVSGSSTCMRIIGDNPSWKEEWDSLPCFPMKDIVIGGVVVKYTGFFDMVRTIVASYRTIE